MSVDILFILLGSASIMNTLGFVIAYIGVNMDDEPIDSMSPIILPTTLCLGIFSFIFVFLSPNEYAIIYTILGGLGIFIGLFILSLCLGTAVLFVIWRLPLIVKHVSALPSYMKSTIGVLLWMKNSMISAPKKWSNEYQKLFSAITKSDLEEISESAKKAIFGEN